MSIFRPRWTAGGPFDDTSSVHPNNQQMRDLAKVDDGVQGHHSPETWFFAAERLSSALPTFPWAKFRLAYVHLLLEDLDGAMELFQEARKLISNADATFEEYFASLKAAVEEENRKAELAWSHPEDDGVIVQHWHPPRDFDAFRHQFPSHTSELLREWHSYQQKLGPDIAAQRYARLAAVQSSELEDVFTLGGESLNRIVRAGFFGHAVDRVLKGPPGGIEHIVQILRDFKRCLNYFSASVLPADAISQDDLRSMHRELMKSSRIGFVHTDDDSPIPYLNMVGDYRRRLVIADMNPEDANEDEPPRIVQFARHQEIELHMQTFLEMMHERLSKFTLGTGDPIAFALAAWIHYHLAVIHPFTDGNGRLGRIVSSLPLLKAGFPPINIRRCMKPKYLEALHKAATTQDLGFLTELIASEMRESIRYLSTLHPPSSDDSQWRLNINDGVTRIVI
ncbi:unnamed protein product [Cyclocybe aegerita]|uniref:protein adenylyltransferase n=1 Tax=Cyclocybe aegerita TaxID=1973307 RepID=A0A8S0XI97_CYCAE|nr:unnamed protein product [Cyclocybe aegerita]